ITISKPWQNITINMVNYVMVILLALTFAYWFWIIFKPLPIPKVQPLIAPTETILPSILAGHWFNQAKSPAVVADNSNLKLLGVFSTTHNNPGFAIFKLADGKQTHALLNHEVLLGTQLVAITKNSVTISQNGVESKVMLEDNKNIALKPVESINTGGFNIQSLINKK
ncbi:MAG: hypothetical protein H7Z18_03150, partial [Methylophilaceae bacterium]|nr:hypothetical protein [Methylophilaceae bacterium]